MHRERPNIYESAARVKGRPDEIESLLVAQGLVAIIGCRSGLPGQAGLAPAKNAGRRGNIYTPSRGMRIFKPGRRNQLAALDGAMFGARLPRPERDGDLLPAGRRRTGSR